MATGDLWTVNTNDLYIRNDPSTNNPPVGAMLRGDNVTEISRSDNWVKISYIDLNGDTQYGWMDSGCMSCTPARDISVITTTEDPMRAEDYYKSDTGYLEIAQDDLFMYENQSVDDSDFVQINKVAGVFGLPYQFLPSADPRLSASSDSQHLGYEYAERIVSRIPLLFIAPGKPTFMKQYSDSAKASVLQQLMNAGGTSGDKQSLNSLLEEDGRYYTFEYDQARYYKFVNPMCRIAARYMGVQDIKIDNQPIDTINWETFTQSRIQSLGDFGDFSSIPFYLDSDSSISESFSNSTTQSMIAGIVNNISDMGREINFLMGYGGSALDIINSNADVAAEIDAAQDVIQRALGSGNFLSNLANHITTVAAGGRLIFPEIWADSSFARSYNCRFKFIAPDPSPLSVYINVIVPLLHLVGLVAPQSIEKNPNGYTSPFLVRAIYKGAFNVDMGIITDMSITKGAECQWTPEGVPTSIEVSISIKDLYQVLSITPTSAANFNYDTMNNTALMDYIANLCGVNMYKPEISRMIDMWYTNNIQNRPTDAVSGIWTSIQQRVQNTIMGIFRD